MRFVDGRADLLEDVDDPPDRQTALFRQHVRKGPTVEILHDQIGDLARRRFGETKVRDVDDVGVTQPSRGFRFAPEPLHELRTP